jgi:hypothetical protein
MSDLPQQLTIGENCEFRKVGRSGEVIEIRFGDALDGYDSWIPVALLDPSPLHCCRHPHGYKVTANR